jgi:hypothetical protein
MERKAMDNFGSIPNEADKIDKPLLTASHPEDIPGNIHLSLSCLVKVLEILVKNTNLKTNDLNPEVLTNVNGEEIEMHLERIRLLTRRIERALMINGETN